MSTHKKACDCCALRKVKCDSTQPCAKCVKAGIDCTYLNIAKKTGPKRLRQSTYQAIKRNRREHERERELAAAATTAYTEASMPPDWATVPSSTDDRNSSYSPPSHSATFAPINGMTLPPFMNDSFTFVGEQAVVPLSAVQTYLEVYFEQMYPVWPVVSRWPLVSFVQEAHLDPDIYGLVCSLCAATVAQLRLPARVFPATLSPLTSPISPVSATFSNSSMQSQINPASLDTRGAPGIMVSSDLLLSEAMRARSKMEYQENATIATLLTSFFIHVYYGHVLDRSRTATIYLRESITFAQLLGLHDENTYQNLEISEKQSRRRLFWLLFITERGNALQHSIPVVLKSTIKLPEIHADEDPLVLSSFIQLVHLFENFDESIVDAWNRRANAKCTREHLETLQTKLDGMGSQLQQAMDNSLEVQKADVLVTREWMRILIWQLSMTHGYLSSAQNVSDNMQLSYPAQIARDLLEVTSSVSEMAIYTHGHGMEVKLFEVANSLADVILCAPNTLPNASSYVMGPRDFLHGLTGMLMNFRGGGDAQLLSFLTRKSGDALKLHFKSAPRSALSSDSDSTETRRNSLSGLSQSYTNDSATTTSTSLPDTPPEILKAEPEEPPQVSASVSNKLPNFNEFLNIPLQDDQKWGALAANSGAFDIPEFDAYFLNNGTTYRLSVSSSRSRDREASIQSLQGVPGITVPATPLSPSKIFDIDESQPASLPDEFGQAMEDLQDNMGNKMDWNDIQKAFNLNNTINRWMDVATTSE